MTKRKVKLNNLKAIRKKLGMSQNDFGDMLGFPRTGGKTPQSSYRKYESGELMLSAEHAYTITRTFSIDLKDLLEY